MSRFGPSPDFVIMFLPGEATADDGELKAPQAVEVLPRPLLAPELTVVRETGGALERTMRVS